MEKPFDTANIPGPEMGKISNPNVMGKLISRAKRPLLIVGAEILEDGLIDKAIEMSKKGIPIAATGHSCAGFVDKGYNEFTYFGLHELTNCLRDPDWKGLDEEGNYDVVIFLGITYYLASQMLSTVKNFCTSPRIRGISIDRYYHPNAGMSFDNYGPQKMDEYKSMLDEVIENIRR